MIFPMIIENYHRDLCDKIGGVAKFSFGKFNARYAVLENVSVEAVPNESCVT